MPRQLPAQRSRHHRQSLPTRRPGLYASVMMDLVMMAMVMMMLRWHVVTIVL